MKNQKTARLLAALVLVALVSWGCQIGDTSGPTQVVTITQPTPSPTPAPVASPSPGSTAIPAGSYVRVGMFSCSCPGGGGCGPNSAATVPVGCTANITATPKDAAGNDLPATVHGPAIFWSIFGGGAVCTAVEEPFNRRCVGVSAGTTVLRAEVPGMRAGELALTVIP